MHYMSYAQMFSRINFVNLFPRAMDFLIIAVDVILVSESGCRKL